MLGAMSMAMRESLISLLTVKSIAQATDGVGVSRCARCAMRWMRRRGEVVRGEDDLGDGAFNSVIEVLAVEK